MATPTTSEATAMEVERMTLQQRIIVEEMDKKLVVAPLDLSKHHLEILDVCCCDGLWLRDLKAFTSIPSNKYFGVDINTMMFPETSEPSVMLSKQDFTEPFPAEWKNKFDLVHQRYALPAAMNKPIEPIINSLVEMVKPGGYIQLGELDHRYQPEAGPAFTMLFVLIGVMLDMFGIGHYFIEQVPQYVKNSGIQDIEQHELDVHVGRANSNSAFGEMGTELFVKTAQGFAAMADSKPLHPFCPYDLLTDVFPL